jgi:hypothetical protein
MNSHCLLKTFTRDFPQGWSGKQSGLFLGLKDSGTATYKGFEKRGTKVEIKNAIREEQGYTTNAYAIRRTEIYSDRRSTSKRK